MDLLKSLMVSASGMRAQSVRMRVISENLANANSVAPSPNVDPYRRKVVTFENEMDNQLGVDLLKVDKIEQDHSKFERKYDPGHPAADKNGYVRMPNVNPFVEMMDMRQAQRSYEANLTMIETAKSMLSKTVGILR
ncbi:MAG TPA: flagellar basal body rod protein FlgC [Alphaproteobacteria bacterium]|nr:flagellar basal body rod protein FlgC [Alphaproteobacteria bacterium]